jgi:hypothetical protein
MSKRELIARELESLPDRDVDRLLAFLQTLHDHSEPPLKVRHANDWLTPEDEAWAEL